MNGLLVHSKRNPNCFLREHDVRGCMYHILFDYMPHEEYTTPRFKNSKKKIKDWDLVILNNNCKNVDIGFEFKLTENSDPEDVMGKFDNEYEISKKEPSARYVLITCMNKKENPDKDTKKNLKDIKQKLLDYRKKYNKKIHYLYIEVYQDRSNPKVIIDGILKRLK